MMYADNTNCGNPARMTQTAQEHHILYCSALFFSLFTQ